MLFIFLQLFGIILHACTVRTIQSSREIVSSLLCTFGKVCGPTVTASQSELTTSHTFCLLLGGCCSLARLLNMYLIWGM